MKAAEGIILEIEDEWEALLGARLKDQLIRALEKLMVACSEQDVGPAWPPQISP